MALMIENLSKQLNISGKWQDTIIHSDGRREVGVNGSINWNSNQIQNTFASLLAAWARGEAGYNHITYLAIGHGDASWDITPPTLNASDTTLNDEYFRKAIIPADIYFIDPTTNLPTGGTPSPKLEIVVTLQTTEANGVMREFGLFGGTATATLDSGEMVNWVYHSRIDKDSSIEIERRIRLLFATT